jgi:hypothetical protein
LTGNQYASISWPNGSGFLHFSLKQSQDCNSSEFPAVHFVVSTGIILPWPTFISPEELYPVSL